MAVTEIIALSVAAALSAFAYRISFSPTPISIISDITRPARVPGDDVGAVLGQSGNRLVRGQARGAAAQPLVRDVGGQRRRFDDERRDVNRRVLVSNRGEEVLR